MVWGNKFGWCSDRIETLPIKFLWHHRFGRKRKTHRHKQHKRICGRCGDYAVWYNNGLTTLFVHKVYSATISSIGAGKSVNVSRTDLGIETPSGYASFAIRAFVSENLDAVIYSANTSSTSAILRVRNISTSALSNVAVSVDIVFIKTGFLGNA